MEHLKAIGWVIITFITTFATTVVGAFFRHNTPIINQFLIGLMTLFASGVLVFFYKILIRINYDKIAEVIEEKLKKTLN